MTTDGERDEDVPSRDELVDRVADLESTLQELRRETMRPPRGPFGLPRPPTPGELVAFTDEHAIPATIAFLEVNIRALQAFQAALRLARGTSKSAQAGRRAGSRTTELGARTIDALDSALQDLKNAYEAGTLPDDPTARRVLSDARRLTDEVREELESVRTQEYAADTGRSRTRDAARETDSEARDTNDSAIGDPAVDLEEVETELEVLREEFTENTDDPGDDAQSGDDGDSSDVDSDDSSEQGGPQ